MNNEITIQLTNQDGIPMVSSRVVTQDFGKQHKHVLETINNLLGDLGVAENSADLFIESKYQHPQNKQWYKEYLMTRDGFSLLVMGFTGKEALQWKLKYIEAFNQMEEMIKQQLQPQLDSYMIADPIERAKQWIIEQEARQQLMIENQKLAEEVKTVTKENNYKEEVIIGLTEEIPMAELRQRISRVVRHGGRGRYAERYGLLYKEFNEKFHMSVDLRMKRDIENGLIKKSTTKMDYICDVLGMTEELYELTVKIFEGDFKHLIGNMNATINGAD